MDTSADLDQAQIDDATRTAKAAGNELRGLRNKRRLTQTQLGALLGVDQKTIQRMENGEREFKLGEIRAIARALGTTATEFIAAVEKELGIEEI
jgi:transcriptional regulator with XRE-family HTH domain